MMWKNQRVIQLGTGRSDMRLGCGNVSTKRGWPDRVLSTVSEELPKSDFALCRDRALARSRTSHVEPSIQVGIWSVVGEV